MTRAEKEGAAERATGCRLWLILFVSMFIAVAIATVIAIFDGGYLAFIPLVAWFILGQIFIVPKLRKASSHWMYRWWRW
jgi:hypothetical protein